MLPTVKPLTQRRRLALIGIAWLAMIGFDFLLHAGLLARWYSAPAPFLLPPAQAFVRIPWGYLSLVLLAVLLLWVLSGIQVSNWRQGGIVGLWVGALVWGSLTLGLYSISTAPPQLLVGWCAGQTIEMGIAGVILGAGLSGHPLVKLLLKTIGLVVAAVVVTVALQMLGMAPAQKIGDELAYDAGRARRTARFAASGCGDRPASRAGAL